MGKNECSACETWHKFDESCPPSRDEFNTKLAELQSTLNTALEYLAEQHERVLNEYGVDHWCNITDFLKEQGIKVEDYERMG